ncbi:hypothetical protein ET495_08075 [Xylanimonas allomyrinae]|uniref:Bacterial transcriptional activator domain-containing protein n=1 Tax=Xylanimonas allomyrinae TaxID=2509459 RepID=A0A4P6ENB4_9MICO|nr:bacterial transcriptional activator domain-containing protein [Xylanimonas allomyrinae]QAY63203.1 hypothetical protein ET495_08075 [Xylanimonas allomyrinae]
MTAPFLDPAHHPRVQTVALSRDRITLHLDQPADLVSPWAGEGTTWSTPVDADFPDVETTAPYPMLVSIGAATDGTVWLLNLEQTRTLHVTGTPSEVEAFARHVAVELATAPWAALVDVHTIAVGADLDDLNGTRLTHHRDPSDALLTATAEQVESTAHSGDWDPEDRTVLVLGATVDPATTRRLATGLAAHETRPAVAVLALGEANSDDTLEVRILDGRLHIDALAIDVQAALLPADDAAGIKRLLTVLDTHENTPMPVDEITVDGIGALVDRAGAIRPTLTEPRTPATLATGRTVLPEPELEYADAAALTVEDVHTLAPAVSDHVAEQVIAADPDLDRDLAWWHQGNDCPVPRVELLGSVTIHGHGRPGEVINRREHYAEIATFITITPGEPSARDIAEAFHISEERARVSVSNLRAYLGEHHLPKSVHSTAGPHGWTGYHLDGVLFDVELFTRLRARAQALGTLNDGEGIAYLVEALRLVRGEPFTDRRAGSWAWLNDRPDRPDMIAAAAAVDVALILHGHDLHPATTNLPRARWAAETALKAAPYDDSAWLALAQVADAEGNHAEAHAIRVAVDQRTDDERPPLDPPARTRRG